MNIKQLQNIFAERLKELMAEKDLPSVQEFAKQIGIPRTTVSNWLNLVRNPQIDSLVAIAKFFSVTTDYLLGLED